MGRRISSFVQQCDVIHIHELWHYAHYVAWRVAQKRNIPVIISPRGGLDSWALEYRGLRKKVYGAVFQQKALKAATFVHALTPREADAVARYGVERSRIRVIPNGLPETTVARLAGIIRSEQAGLGSDHRSEEGYGLFLGRIHPKKGLDLLVRALSKLLRRHPDVRIIVAGPDESGHRKYVEGLARAAGVADHLVFHDVVKGDDKWHMLTHARFFVLPSYSEGFSNAILEALAAGTPVVATRACEVGTLEQSGAAVLVEPDADALAAGLDQVLSSPELARRVSENGRRLVLQRYTWERVAPEVMRLYEDALQLA